MRGSCGQGLDHLGHVDVGLVADGIETRNGQGAPRHGEVAGDVAGLGDDGNAAGDGVEPVFVGPECCAVEGVDEAVAVGAHQRHAVRRLEHGLLQMRVAGLGEARGIDHRAAAALGAELPDDLDGGLALHRDEGGIDRTVDLVDGFQRRHAAQLLALGMDGVDPARVSPWHGVRPMATSHSLPPMKAMEAG